METIKQWGQLERSTMTTAQTVQCMPNRAQSTQDTRKRVLAWPSDRSTSGRPMRALIQAFAGWCGLLLVGLLVSGCIPHRPLGVINAQVIEDETGKPIAGAFIQITVRTTVSNLVHSTEVVVGGASIRSDAQGRYQADLSKVTITRGNPYSVYFSTYAPGYDQYFSGSQEDPTVRMRKPYKTRVERLDAMQVRLMWRHISPGLAKSLQPMVDAMYAEVRGMEPFDGYEERSLAGWIYDSKFRIDTMLEGINPETLIGGTIDVDSNDPNPDRRDRYTKKREAWAAAQGPDMLRWHLQAERDNSSLHSTARRIAAFRVLEKRKPREIELSEAEVKSNYDGTRKDKLLRIKHVTDEQAMDTIGKAAFHVEWMKSGKPYPESDADKLQFNREYAEWGRKEGWRKWE
jgi:hypothetical protein